MLKNHSIFWCRGVNNKHDAAERWDLEFGFQILPLRSVMIAYYNVDDDHDDGVGELT